MSGNFIDNRIITKTVSIFSPLLKVWDALTVPELMKRWMLDSEIEITVDLKTGGPVIIRGNLHELAFENRGIILQLTRGKIFQYTSLSSLSNLADKDENYSVITFTLDQRDDMTEVTFSQSNFAGATSYEHSNFYWNSALMVLKRMLEN